MEVEGLFCDRGALVVGRDCLCVIEGGRKYFGVTTWRDVQVVVSDRVWCGCFVAVACWLMVQSLGSRVCFDGGAIMVVEVIG